MAFPNYDGSISEEQAAVHYSQEKLFQVDEVPFVSSPSAVTKPPTKEFADDPLSEDIEEQLENQQVLTGREEDFVKAYKRLENQDADEGIISEDENPAAFEETLLKTEVEPSAPISDGFEAGAQGNAATRAEVKTEAKLAPIGSDVSKAKAEGEKLAAIAIKSGEAGNGGATGKTEGSKQKSRRSQGSPSSKSAAGSSYQVTCVTVGVTALVALATIFQ